MKVYAIRFLGFLVTAVMLAVGASLIWVVDGPPAGRPFNAIIGFALTGGSPLPWALAQRMADLW
jgi:hypothetical protein